MAQRRIFAKKRPRRGRVAAALTAGAVLGLAAGGAVFLLQPTSGVPGCADAAVRADLLDLLQDDPRLADAAPLRLSDVDERKRTFKRGELFARDCAAAIAGAPLDVRFRITRDDAHGYVVTLRGA